jgi:hypothetical protein
LKELVKLLFCILALISCANSVNENEEDALLYSPDKDKKIDFYNLADQLNNTQIGITFKSSFLENGGGIFSIKADRNEVEVYWLNNETIIIEYPAEKEVYQKENSIKSFDKLVQVNYKPFDYSRITSIETVISDHIEPIILIKIGEENYNKALMLVNENQERLAIPRSKNSEYEYGNIYVESGKYRIMVQGVYEYQYTEYFEIEKGKINIITLE